MSQNIFQMFSSDPVEFNMKHLKAQIFMALITLIRERNMSQVEAARFLQISQPRVSNLFKGHLEKFSIDGLLEMLVRLGYKVETTFNPENAAQPLVMTLNKTAF